SLLQSLQARVQPEGYGYGSNKGLLSSRWSGQLRNGIPVPTTLAPISSPSLLYSTLFSTGVPNSPNPPSGPNPVVVDLQRKKSVLDRVLGQSQRLMAKVDNEDRARLDQHFTEIRELENKILGQIENQSLPMPTTSGCADPGSPPTDPQRTSNAQFNGWSNEELRAELQAEMIAYALACDLTRAVSWMITWDQSGLSGGPISGTVYGMHETTHSGTRDEMAVHANWHADQFRKLVQKLGEIDDGNGQKLIDNTVATMGYVEGYSAHTSRGLTVCIAGCGDRLRLGRHISGGNNEHPAQVMTSGLQAIGMPVTGLGDVQGNIPGLVA
ncbi:MAG: DUF1552 domain-containing protein, partial [Myxococcota bacterium]